MLRPSHVVAAALALVAAACNDTDTNFVNTTAKVRLVNDSDTPLSVAFAGVVDSANSRLVFGQSTACVLVDLSIAEVAPLTVTSAVTGTSITSTPTFTVGANLTIVAFGDETGKVQLTALDNRFVPAPSDAGLRSFNGAPGVGSLSMRRDGATLTSAIAFGSASNFVNVPTDAADITFSNGASVVLDAGLIAFPLGQNSTVLVGPPATGTTPLRSFTVQGC
jgi:hypothetical protein